MKTLARTLLLWLMLIAVPFQGFASAAMLACAHRTTQGAPAAAAPAAGHDAMHSAHHGHDHEHGVAPAGQAASGHHDMHDPGAQKPADHHAQCGSCAACCFGAAMAPATIPAASAVSLPVPRAPAGASRLAAVDLDLPERPPRFPFA